MSDIIPEVLLQIPVLKAIYGWRWNKYINTAAERSMLLMEGVNVALTANSSHRLLGFALLEELRFFKSDSKSLKNSSAMNVREQCENQHHDNAIVPKSSKHQKKKVCRSTNWTLRVLPQLACTHRPTPYKSSLLPLPLVNYPLHAYKTHSLYLFYTLIRNLDSQRRIINTNQLPTQSTYIHCRFTLHIIALQERVVRERCYHMKNTQRLFHKKQLVTGNMKEWKTEELQEQSRKIEMKRSFEMYWIRRNLPSLV